jgi:hypothetical protein
MHRYRNVGARFNIALVLCILNLECNLSALIFPHGSQKVTDLRVSSPTRLSSGSTKDDDTGLDRSTLSLLEHVNVAIPSHEFAVPFYYDMLGCGLDPRMAHNLVGIPVVSSTIWANCGASQFHLCYSPESPHTLPGRIGLRYHSLDGLKQRIERHIQATAFDNSKRCFQSVTHGQDSLGNPQITLLDRYDNVFVCRTVPTPPQLSPISTNQPILSSTVSLGDEWADLASRFGREVSDCRGIDYLEIPCPKGTAETVAEFYESVFDATTNLATLPDDSKIAMVAFGNIQTTGRADQYLLFKEENTSMTGITQSTTWQKGRHRIALYVGDTQADFEQAFRNAELAGVVWTNQRFQDKVDSLDSAREWKQFRFKDVVDLNTGRPILDLEHEVRSMEHPAWPGKK